MLREGVIPGAPKVREVADRLMVWVPLMAFACYVVVAVLAQVRLDVLSQL